MNNNNPKFRYQITKMKKADLPVLSVFGADAFGPKGLGEPWDQKKYLQHLYEVFNAEHSLIVKEKDKVVAGLVAYPMTFEFGTELFIDTIIVEKKKRGTGIGTQLMEQAIELAREKKLTGIRLMSHPKLQAYQWYSKLHFKKTGWVDLHKEIKGVQSKS